MHIFCDERHALEAFFQPKILRETGEKIFSTSESLRYQFTGEEAPMLMEEMIENPESDWDEDEEDEEEEEADNQWNVPALD